MKPPIMTLFPGPDEAARADIRKLRIRCLVVIVNCDQANAGGIPFPAQDGGESSRWKRGEIDRFAIVTGAGKGRRRSGCAGRPSNCRS
jgi:hypothetical protein